nr:HAMP domain-containing methyl-accepting chemotaxis protein [Bacillus sp. Marseille-P3800]
MIQRKLVRGYVIIAVLIVAFAGLMTAFLRSTQQTLEQFGQELEGTAFQQVQGLQDSLMWQLVSVWGIVIVLLVCGAVIARQQARMVLIPIRRLLRRARHIAEGDRSRKPLPVIGEDEFAEFTEAFNEMTEELNQTLERASTLASTLISSTSYLTEQSTKTLQSAVSIEEGNQRMLDAVHAQVETSQKSVQSTDDLSEKVEHITMALAAAENATETVHHLVQEGNRKADDSQSSMGAIVKNNNSTLAVVNQLNERSKRLIDMVQTVEAIANQTNLLALNAEIEAAHAGEQGRGFAVVAEEVRKLAAESQGAAQQMTAVIETVQDDTKSVLSEMEIGNREIQQGLTANTEMNRVLAEINQACDRLNQDIYSVSSSTQSIAFSTISLVDQLAVLKEASVESGKETKTGVALAKEQVRTMEEVIEKVQSIERAVQELSNVTDLAEESNSEEKENVNLTISHSA